jgi:hypothetical protein
MWAENRMQREKNISLAPLDFEEALEGLLKTEPPPEKKEAKEKAPPKGRRSRKRDCSIKG